MILIQIDSLSRNELDYIALQEGIEDFETLSREELISELKDIYEEEDDSVIKPEIGDVRKRFLSGLTNTRGVEVKEEKLPGVEELPLTYADTAIHLLVKNATWLYCYWSVSPYDMAKIEERLGSVSFVLSGCVKNGTREVFEIPVNLDDSEWNIGVPHNGGECQVELVAVNKKGDREVVAVSEIIPLVSVYWLEHKNEIKENDSLMRLYLSLVTNKEGKVVKVEPITEIVNIINKEGCITK